jgi:hypothetical protein
VTEQETTEQQIIGKRIVAVAWTPVPDKDMFAVSSITLEGGTTLDFRGSYYEAVCVKVKEANHEP